MPGGPHNTHRHSPARRRVLLAPKPVATRTTRPVCTETVPRWFGACPSRPRQRVRPVEWARFTSPLRAVFDICRPSRVAAAGGAGWCWPVDGAAREAVPHCALDPTAGPWWCWFIFPPGTVPGRLRAGRQPLTATQPWRTAPGAEGRVRNHDPGGPAQASAARQSTHPRRPVSRRLVRRRRRTSRVDWTPHLLTASVAPLSGRADSSPVTAGGSQKASTFRLGCFGSSPARPHRRDDATRRRSYVLAARWSSRWMPRSPVVRQQDAVGGRRRHRRPLSKLVFTKILDQAL